MQIKDLIKSDLSSLSDEELQKALSILSKPIVQKRTSSGVTRKVTPNKEKQLQDLLKKMTPEQLQKFKLMLENGE